MGHRDSGELPRPTSSPVSAPTMHLFSSALSTGDLLAELTCTQSPLSAPVEMVCHPSEFVENV